MSIWHLAIALVIVGVLAAAIAHLKRAGDSGDMTKIGGWLVLLVAGLMIFGPLLGAVRLDSSFVAAEFQYRLLSKLPEWATYKTAAWSAFWGTSLFTFYAGWRLAYTRRATAVTTAIIALWTAGPAMTLVINILLPALIFGKAELPSSDVSTLFGSALMAGIWTAYLLRSKRVKVRYVDGLIPAPGVAMGV